MTKYVLYQHADFRSSRCTWVIEELGIKDEFEFIDFNPYKASEGEMRAYKARAHPLGLVPALVLPDGVVMVESGAICMYLAEKYEKMLPPQNEKHAYYSWIMFANATADAHLKEMGMANDPERYHVHVTRLKGFLAALERHLQDKQYICSSGLTVGDIVVAYPLYWITELKEKTAGWLEDFPRVRTYFETLKSRPIAKKWLTP